MTACSEPLDLQPDEFFDIFTQPSFFPFDGVALLPAFHRHRS